MRVELCGGSLPNGLVKRRSLPSIALVRNEGTPRLVEISESDFPASDLRTICTIFTKP